MYSKFGQFIDGKWQHSANKETYDVINPATEEVIGKASKASPADVDKALKSSERGFAVWKKFSSWDPLKLCKRTLVFFSTFLLYATNFSPGASLAPLSCIA